MTICVLTVTLTFDLLTSQSTQFSCVPIAPML